MNNADDADQANKRLMLALGGVDFDLTAALADLLRSEHPIHPVVREGLINALEGRGTGGINLKAQGMGKGSSPRAQMDKEKQRLAIGKAMHLNIAGGMKYEDAAHDIDQRFGVQSSKAGNDLAFYREKIASAEKAARRDDALNAWWEANFGRPISIAHLLELGISDGEAVGAFIDKIAEENGFSDK